MAWLLDTNVFVSAKRDHYGFEFCPGFWEWLDRANAAGTVASVEAVYDELVDYGDQLSDWAKDRRGFFRPVTADDTILFSPLGSGQRQTAWRTRPVKPHSAFGNG